MANIIKGNDDIATTYILKRFDHAVIIDPGGNYEQISELIEGFKIDYILLTHAHADHLALIGLFNCPVYLHKDDYYLLTDDINNGFKDIKMKRQYDINKIYFKDLKDLEAIDFVDQKIEIIHTPGHTKGSVCFLYNHELFTGDTLFKEGVGRTDLYGGSNTSLTKSIKRLFISMKDNIKILPGHDDLSTIKYEKQHNKYVIQTLKK
ncbi:MAG TPA: MBL fold metallo-hydrolase [Acholeplasma sp.]|nr:MBL fold metallo-hydrolase [Acholeplasma sp.]